MELEPTTSLGERTRLIFEALNVAVLEVGHQFIEAKREHPTDFVAWVESELPWSLDTVERYMAITRAFANASPEIRDALPRPYTTLYELTRRPVADLRAAITSGTVNPDITHSQAREWARASDPTPMRHLDQDLSPRKKALPADVVAKQLLRYKLDEVDPELRVMLGEWLNPVPFTFRRLELVDG